MAKGKTSFTFYYSVLIMVAGYSILGGLLLYLNIDLWREYLVFISFGMLLEWLVLPLPAGSLSVGFTLVFTSFLIYGTPATAWISSIAAVFSQGIINRGHSLRITLFNGGQYAVAAFIAGWAYENVGGILGIEKVTLDNIFPLGVYIFSYFIINHLLVNIYLSPQFGRHTLSVWKAAIKWDGITYVFATPLSLLMVFLYGEIGVKGVGLLFVLVLIMKYLLKLYIDLDLANRELRALYHVAKSLGGSLEIETTLNIILEETRKVIKYHTGVVYLFRDSDKELVPAAIQSPYAKNLKNVTVKLGEGLVGRVALYREPEVIFDSREISECKKSSGLSQFLRSMIVFPLVADDHVVGVMVVGKREPNGFTEKQMQVMTILGSQASVATAKALLYRRIEAMAITDGLTKIYNHRFFYQRIEEEFTRAKRYGCNFSLIMMDIDFFKKFNDTYGHKAGDRALKHVSKQISNSIRTVDILARYGGEEFAVILPETPKEKALIIAERIRRAIKTTPFEIHPAKPMVTVSVSVGVAGYPEDANHFQDLIEAADQALYSAKRGGRNRVCVYDKSVNG